MSSDPTAPLPSNVQVNWDIINQPYDQIVCFGDSITEFAWGKSGGYGYVQGLADSYVRKVDVINRGFSGYTSQQGFVALPHFIPRPDQANVRFMTVFFGANDATLPDTPTGQHVPLEDYKNYLKKIVNHPFVKLQNPRIIFITPPPINEYQVIPWNKEKGIHVVNRVAAVTKQYAEACKEVAAELDGVEVADIWSAMMKLTGWKEGSGEPLPGSKEAPESEALKKLLVDGLHLLPAGYQIVYDEVMDVIKKVWPDQLPENLNNVLPPWEQMKKE